MVITLTLKLTLEYKSHSRILLALANANAMHNPMTRKQICQITKITNTHVVATIKSLKKDGLINEQTVDKRNTRHITLTSKGDIVAHHLKAIYEMLE